MRRRIIRVVGDKCRNCGFCLVWNVCRSSGFCMGCLSCFFACPFEARAVEYVDADVEMVTIYVDGVPFRVPGDVSVAEALRYCGFVFGEPGGKEPWLGCGTGGCWACALVIDGVFERTCITPVRDGMRVETDVEGVIPRRIVHGPSPHMVGGKGTPWWEVNYRDYVEAALWVAGCNLRCPQCQNYHVTYDNVSPALTPSEAAREVVLCHRKYGTRGIAVSGGEPTLNRRWLTGFFREVTRLVSPKVRRHLDSNGTLLKPDYVDELVEAGCNNFGVEPKCVSVETYMKITGLKDRDLARKYLETVWKAIEYIDEKYGDKVFLGVGLVYNRELVSLEELAKAGEKIASINPRVQITVLDYFPAFRRRHLKRPTVEEMLEVKRILEDQGLKTVIEQTEIGHIGSGNVKRP